MRVTVTAIPDREGRGFVAFYERKLVVLPTDLKLAKDDKLEVTLTAATNRAGKEFYRASQVVNRGSFLSQLEAANAEALLNGAAVLEEALQKGLSKDLTEFTPPPSYTSLGWIRPGSGIRRMAIPEEIWDAAAVQDLVAATLPRIIGNKVYFYHLAADWGIFDKEWKKPPVLLCLWVNAEDEACWNLDGFESIEVKIKGVGAPVAVGRNALKSNAWTGATRKSKCWESAVRVKTYTSDAPKVDEAKLERHYGAPRTSNTARGYTIPLQSIIPEYPEQKFTLWIAFKAGEGSGGMNYFGFGDDYDD